MQLLSALILLWMALVSPARAAGFKTVLTLDNGEFNMPLYTPRWNGRWAQPSAAQEIATSLARINGENPTVYTYLAAGREAGRSGEPHRIEARLPRCVGSAEADGDPCFCGPGDKCWEQIGPNYHPESSTSLYLTAGAVRAAWKGKGPRVEVHLTDLFEEDPSTAENPADSDRCVTLDGARKAVEGLVQPGEGESLDHLAIGVLRVRVEPPPPGPSHGYTYKLLQPDGDSCWSGEKGWPWESLRPPYEMSMAVLVLGIDTASVHGEVAAFLDGLEAQWSSEFMEVELVGVREPEHHRSVDAIVSGADAGTWALDRADRRSTVPCTGASAKVALSSGGLPVATSGVAAACDGSATVSFGEGTLASLFAQQAGIDPTRSSIVVGDTLRMTGDDGDLDAPLAALRALNLGAAHRPLPLWEAVEPAARSRWRPWTQEIEVSALTVTDLDTRPWLLAVSTALAMSVVMGWFGFRVLQKTQAERAIQAHWDRSVGPDDDPLRQRPLATVLAEAQEEVRAQWPSRITVGLAFAVLAASLGMWMVIRLHAVSLG